MRLRFKTVLSFILLLIIGCLSIGSGYVYYVNYIKKEAVVVANGDLTINYANGNDFSKYKNTNFSFSVTNNSDKVVYYYILIKNIKGNNKDVLYELKSNNSDILVSGKLKSEIIYNSITIDPHKTDSYVLRFYSDSDKSYGGEVFIESKLKDDITFADIILKNNKVNEATLSKVGENSVVDEGLQKDVGENGPVYYFRGNINDNYVLFGDLNWRIVKINDDGSVKLVLDDILDVLGKYYEGNNSHFKDSVIRDQLNRWFNTKLGNYNDLIANYKFCNDYVRDDKTNNYVAYNRINTDIIPSFICFGEKVNTKIGLLTADEVLLAGGSKVDNKSYYLYNEGIKEDYFTMTSSKLINNIYYPFVVDKNGRIVDNVSGTLNRGVRPVINVIHNVTATGDGTKDNPYIIEEIIKGK